jgi:hypothetical protein
VRELQAERGDPMASKKEDEGYTLTLTGPGHTFERQVDEGIATRIHATVEINGRYQFADLTR